LDTDCNHRLLALCNKAAVKETKFSNDIKEDNQIKDLLKEIKPLLFPLLENEYQQGFMWEREWRYPKEDGLLFTHGSVRVICCPKDERAEIEEILKDYLNGIQIVESWKEYDEVTNYLKRREREVNQSQLENIEKINNLAELKALKEQNEQTVNSLEAYYSVFKGSVTIMEGNNISGLLASMKEKSKQISDKIKKLQEEELQKIKQRKEEGK
jgi:hypothetical protein